MDSRNNSGKPLVAIIAFLALTVGVVLMGCSGTSEIETGRTFDASTFSEGDGRETLSVAVRDYCLGENLGVSRLVGPLRTVETATAIKGSTDWKFHSDGKTATVSPTGQVSGDLLKDLTSEC